MLRPRHKSPFGPATVKSEINVTPLVDVCLVLLIIFMVVTPMLQKGVDVQLPETMSPEKMPENERQLTVSLRENGNIFLQENWIPEESALQEQLTQMHEQSPDRAIVIKGDRRIKYKEVRRIMQVINEAGFTRVGLVMEREGGTNNIAS